MQHVPRPKNNFPWPLVKVFVGVPSCGFHFHVATVQLYSAERDLVNQ